MPYRVVTKFRGVYQRTSEIKLHNNRHDICYDINYQIGNRLIWEKIGWATRILKFTNRNISSCNKHSAHPINSDST